MIINTNSIGLAHAASAAANLRCPGCGQLGTFEVFQNGSQDFIFSSNIRVGERRCPKPELSCVLARSVAKQRHSPNFSGTEN